MAVEKVRWQRELSDAGDEVADARAIILKQADRIRELERGFSLKPNPAESRLRLEIGDLQAKLKAAKPTLPKALELLNEVRRRRKKTNIVEADVDIILEVLGGEDEPTELL